MVERRYIMKKGIKFFTVLILTATLLIACGSKNDGDNSNNEKVDLEGTVEEIIVKIQEEAKLESMLMTEKVDLSDSDALKYHLGLDINEGIEEAVVSNAMINTHAFSMALVKVNENVDKIAKEIVSGVDPMKWICVGADDIQVGVYGNYILLVMVDSQLDMPSSNDFFDAFEAVAGSKLDAVYK